MMDRHGAARGIGMAAKRVLGDVTRLFFPSHCLCCDSHLPGARVPGLCVACRNQLMPIEAPFCNVCGEPFEGVINTPFRCGNCAFRTFHFEFAIAGYRSTGSVRELIHAFKYNRRISLRQELGNLLMRGFDDPRICGHQGLLVPVPLHLRKLRERGFNQAEEVARVAARGLDLPLVKALKRLRYTETQAHMHRNQRLHNLRGAVGLARSAKCRAQLEGATIFLIDDVLTTGATAQECARVLKIEGKAARVIVVTVCRAAGFTKPML